MSDTSPNEQTPSEQTASRRRIWATAGLTLGAIATLGVAGGVWWAWVFINEKLSPWVSDFLTESLNRPVVLGDVERVTLTSIQFGPSAIPPTETDPDQVYIDTIDVRFNPLQLFRQRISPDIVLNGVQASIEQNEAGQWIETELDLPEQDPDQEPLIQFNPTIRLQDGEVIVVPYVDPARAPVSLALSNINGSIGLEAVEIEDPGNAEATLDAQEISLDITAEPEDAGTLSVRGGAQLLDYGPDANVSFLETLDANLAIQAQQLDLAVLAPVILASLSQDALVTVNSGLVNANLEVDLNPQGAPQVTGTAQLSQGEVDLDSLPETIRNIRGQARFQGNRVALEDVTAQLANVTAKAGGLIDVRNGYDLTADVAPFQVSELLEALAIDLPVATEGIFRAEATLTGPLADPRATARLISTDIATIDKVQLANIVADLSYTPAAVRLDALEVEPLDGGRLTGSGTYTLAEPGILDVQLEGRDLPADAIGRAYGLPENITLGAVALDAEVSGPLNTLNGVVSWQAPGGTFPTRGTAEVVDSTVFLRDALVEVAGGTIAGTGTLARGQWDANVVAQGIQLGEFEDRLAGTVVGGDLQLAGSLDDLSLQGIQADGDVTAALRGGTLNSQISLNNGGWTADVRTRNFPAGQFVPQVPLGGVDADVNVTGTLDNLTLAGIQAGGTVSAAIAGGTVTSRIELDNGIGRARGEGRGVQLSQLSPELQGTLSVGQFQVAGSLDNLTPAGLQGRVDNVVLSDGLAAAAGVAPQLRAVRSPLTASLAWNGREIQVEQLETAGLSAQGTIVPRLSGPGSPGIAGLDLALAAENYSLSALPIALPPVVGLQGQANFVGRVFGTPDNLNLTGEMELANLALNELTFDPRLVGDVAFSSRAGLDLELIGMAEPTGPPDRIAVNYQIDNRVLDFEVRADDTLAIGETEGDLLRARVYEFPLSALNIPPAGTSPYGPIRGKVTFAQATVNLQDFTTFGQVNIADLGISYASINRVFGAFEYRDGVATLYDGKIRMTDEDARGEPIPDTERIYDIAGSYGIDRTPEITARLATQDGQLQDILEILKIQELADLQRGLVPEEGFIPSSQEEAERLLATRPVGNPDGTFLNQLRRFAEILEIRVQEELQTETAALPSLETLRGDFQGAVNLTATLPDDIAVNFDISGQSWQWGSDFRADQVLAQGSYRNGLISLAPIRFSSGPDTEVAYVDLTGSFSIDPADLQQRQLTLEIVNLPADRIPLERIPGFATLPFDLEGRLNGTATLSGILSDPNLASRFQIVNGSLNATDIEAFTADLNYQEARFGLDAEFRLADSDDPLLLSAEVPYQLPFVERSPADKTFFIDANVQDEGFALLNLFTQQIVTWEEGTGEASLRIAGTLDGNTILTLDTFDGIIELEDATLTSDTLRDFDNVRTPLTNVNGRILLDQRIPLDPRTYAIVVEELNGQFSQGELQARGTFPIFVPLPEEETADSTPVPPEESRDRPDTVAADTDVADTSTDVTAVAEDDVALPPLSQPINQTPLALALEGISLSLRGLYSGQVDGDITVAGSAFQGPKLSGKIDLSNGTVLIPESSGTSSDSTSSGEEGVPIRFSGLQLLLLDDIRIVQGALLDVEGRGGLSLNGTLKNLMPAGTVLLPSGRVGLFSVALKLAGDEDRAEFRGDFDPLLDVTLETSLPDTNSGLRLEPTTSPFPPNEIPDTTIEDLGLTQQGNRLIRIQARYTGRASELSNLLSDRTNLELTSTPLRSESEIIALLSGNVIGAIDALGSGGNALGGFATFAGSALLGTIRNFIGDTGPISEFRIFQVPGGSSGDSEDFGAEIGFDVRPNISVSVLKVLTNNTPFQYNVRYRLSNQLTLRGTTSFEEFQDRTGVLLEYETRF